VHIDYLANHLEMAEQLAGWHVGEWAELLPGWTVLEAENELRSHTRCRAIPTTLVAIEEGKPIGSASLLTSDLDGWDLLSPWLASVFVIPECRGRGLGGQLVGRVVEEARALGVRHLHLWTAGQQAYYERLGWTAFQEAKCHGRAVVIMRRALEPLLKPIS
jgi:predicted N-acetyltransferase YhbS